MRKALTLALVTGLLLLLSTFPAARADDARLGFSLAPCLYDEQSLRDALDASIARGDEAFMARLGSMSLLDTVRNHLHVRAMGYTLATYPNDQALVDVRIEFDVGIGVKIAGARKKGATLTDRRSAMVLRAAEDILAEIVHEGMTALQREVAIHDYLTANVVYDLSHPDGSDAYGALCDGRAKCSGFADAFYLMGTMAGLNVRKVPGVADNVLHEWNAIELDGLWYFVDVTWDAPVGGEPTHMYLNVPTELMAVSHVWQEASEPGPMAQTLDAKHYLVATRRVAATERDMVKLLEEQATPGVPFELLYFDSVDAGAAIDSALESFLYRYSGGWCGSQSKSADFGRYKWMQVTLVIE